MCSLCVLVKVSSSVLVASGKMYTSGSSDQGPSLSLPPRLFQNSEAATVGLAFSSYSTPSLFPVRDTDQRFEIASPVLGAIIYDMDTSSLSENVTITLPIQSVSVPFPYHRLLMWNGTNCVDRIRSSKCFIFPYHLILRVMKVRSSFIVLCVEIKTFCVPISPVLILTIEATKLI